MSPTEASWSCGDSKSYVSQLAYRMFKSLSSGLGAFIVDKKLDDYQQVMRILDLSGLRQVLQVKDLGTLAVVYIDMGSLERSCAYNECATVESPAMKRQCAKECSAKKLKDLGDFISRSLCDVAARIS